ncbi:hypothetical protein [Mangrovivirga cuniculi]|uniref:Outer membrane protein beta-barrel domain-containing protein n=1 Tax=Mangrovivirga cuniculi TaxID=2715131 RepID=A0A4D7JEF5_9BACT|nr:hypothetical protein [Mangrovivirga cuniculi]QCK13543.1 hypothetical protein DCC35_01630 [Mangrovivirga cuniculi]
MNSLKQTILPLLLIFLTISVSAQSDRERNFSREFVWGIKKSTTGGLISGFMFKYGMRRSERQWQSFNLELVNVKHPNESRETSVITGEPFIWGKEHYLYAVRFQYGREYVLFEKADQQGVQVNLIGAAGPTLGFIAPYYIKYATDNQFNPVSEPYDPNNSAIRRSAVMGTGHLFQGLGQSDLTVGLSAKVAFSFEFSTFNSSISGFEVGFLVEAYPNEVILMPAQNNRAIFNEVYITLTHGKRR